MTPQQNIFKVLVLHNKLATEDDVDVLLQQESDPEDVIAKMVIGEMITEAVGDKLLALYRHNLQKQHLQPAAAMAETGHAAPAASTAPHVESRVQTPAPRAEAHPATPQNGHREPAVQRPPVADVAWRRADGGDRWIRADSSATLALTPTRPSAINERSIFPDYFLY